MTTAIPPKYSVIVPVYNRPDEVADLLRSLAEQTYRSFEVILVEDGSTVPCREQAQQAVAKGLPVRYFYKDNEGRSIARNYGIERARGDWMVFFDSDCVVPPEYFATVDRELSRRPEIDFYGGPDAAHTSFSTVQKAINFAMTSVLTTGGIRGGRNVSDDKFVPRTFNMGIRSSACRRVGGFREMFSEDIDMSTRLRSAGYRSALLHDAPVWHKRRVSLRRFLRQVHVFGMSRITLHLLYPGSLKLVHALPALAVIVAVALVLLGVVVSPWFLLPLGLWVLAIFVAALCSTRSLPVALTAIAASAVQIVGYGTGMLRAWFDKILLGHGRDEAQEIEMRRGK